jgi:elongation factor 1-beta
MAMVAVKIKIMPDSPSANTKKIGDEAKKIIESSLGKNCTITEEPIAFGLKAVIAFFAWPEDDEIETLENKLKKIKNINSVQIIDMRRAVG